MKTKKITRPTIDDKAYELCYMLEDYYAQTVLKKKSFDDITPNDENFDDMCDLSYEIYHKISRTIKEIINNFT